MMVTIILRWSYSILSLDTHTTILWPFFRDHLGELVPEENFWTLWCKGRLTEADTDHRAGRHSIRTNQCPPPPSPYFLQAGCPSCHTTNSVKALKASIKSWMYDKLKTVFKTPLKIFWILDARDSCVIVCVWCVYRVHVLVLVSLIHLCSSH